MPQSCKLCVYFDQTAVTAAFASGATDREIAKRFGLSHVSAGRHRREHVVRPMQVAVAALDKGRGVRERRDQLVEAAGSGDPTAIFKLDNIASDIARYAARLDVSADQAASGGQHTAHAALAGQLLRQTEIRARLGGHDRPTQSETQGQTFSVNIHFSTGETVSITTPVQPPATVIDGELEDE